MRVRDDVKVNRSTPGLCLICLRSDGGFTSVEHPIPESLGNTELMLPKGVVCDRCNNGPLAFLDQVLVEFFPLKVRRTELGVESKAGKVPVSVLHTGRLEHFGARGAAIVGPVPKSWREEWRDPRDPRWSVGTVELKGGRVLNERYASELSRALLKLGLECAWTEQGDVVLGAEFDHVRDAILGEPRHGFIFFATAVDKRDTRLSVDFSALGNRNGTVAMLTVFASLYGVKLATASRGESPLAGLDDIGFSKTF